MTENWSRAKMPIFTLHTDKTTLERTITVDRFYPVIVVEGRSIAQADPAYVEHRRTDGTIRFTVANGEATYRIVATNHVLDQYLCELIEAT